MHKQIDAIMQKEMSRKEFLATAGFGIAAIFGMSTILRLVGINNPHASTMLGNGHNASTTLGNGRSYGSSGYGGKK